MAADSDTSPAATQAPPGPSRHTRRRRLDSRLIAAGKSGRSGLTAAIILGVAAGLLVIAQAIVMARIVNTLVFRHAAFSAVLTPFWLLLALFVLRSVLSFAAEIAAHRAAASVKAGIRRQIVEHIFALGPVHAASSRSADLAASAIDGVEALEPYLARYLPQMALVSLVPLAILAAVFPIDWISGLVLIVTGPVIPLFMVFIGYRAEAINQRQWRELLTMSAHLLDAVQGITTLRLFGRARDEIALIARISDDYRRATMAGLRIAFLTSAALEFFASLSIALVAVLFGARLLHGNIAFFPAFLVLLLVPEFFSPLRGLATHYHARMTALAAAERIFDLLDTAPAGSGGTASAPDGKIAILCRGLSLDYDGGRKALDHVDCIFESGRTTAIVGPSGAGKSSLIAAILSFTAPASGEILVQGTDLATISRESWWRQVAYVPQAPRVFAGTIAENLRLTRPEAADEALRAALRRAHLLDEIERLPAGLETPIGEGGAGLSGGQAQRLALARAFLKDAPLVILDEATAHLDLETEALIARSIADLTRGRTAILIAHRLATIRGADTILVMDHGRIVERGPHDELARNEGPYARLLAASGAAAMEAPCAT